MRPVGSTISVTKTKLTKLKTAYARAVSAKQDRFEFEGQLLYTEHARHMIQFMKEMLKSLSATR